MTLPRCNRTTFRLSLWHAILGQVVPVKQLKTKQIHVQPKSRHFGSSVLQCIIKQLFVSRISRIRFIFWEVEIITKMLQNNCLLIKNATILNYCSTNYLKHYFLTYMYFPNSYRNSFRAIIKFLSAKTG